MNKYLLLLIVWLIGFAAHAQVNEDQQYKPEEKLVQLSSGIRLCYVEQGNEEGIPVILLHGFTDSWHSFETVLPYLPSNLHVFALTQRGHGNADKPDSNYHPKDFAADLALFMKEKKIDAAYIAGHSMGGMIAQQFALDYPAMVKGLVIGGSDASFQDNPGMPEFSSMIMQLTDPVSREFADGFQQSTCAHPIDSAYYKILVGETLKVPASVWKAAMRAIMNVNLTSRLNDIRSPVLILWGSKDGFCARSDQETLLKKIRNSRLIIYEETGHALHWEQPGRFAADLVAFVSGK